MAKGLKLVYLTHKLTGMLLIGYEIPLRLIADNKCIKLMELVIKDLCCQ